LRRRARLVVASVLHLGRHLRDVVVLLLQLRGQLVDRRLLLRELLLVALLGQPALIGLVLDVEAAADQGDQEQAAREVERDLQPPFVRVRGDRLDLALVLLLVAKLLEARGVLRVEAGLLELGVADGLDARGLASSCSRARRSASIWARWLASAWRRFSSSSCLIRSSSRFISSLSEKRTELSFCSAMA
jgi:hypothetical protein